MRIHNLLLLVCLAAAPLSADVTYTATRLPEATLRELAAREVAHVPRRIENEKHHYVPPTSAAAAATAPRLSRTKVTGVLAPLPIAKSFLGGASNRLYPADASGAVGPRHVVSVLNTGVRVMHHDGAVVTELSLEQFFQSPNTSAGYFYDPRGAYDSVAGRWIVTCLAGEDSVFMGISKTGDPAGAWTRYSVKLGESSDFSRLAVSSTEIHVATNVGAAYEETLIVSAPKADMYDGKNEVSLSGRRIRDFDVAPVASEHEPETYLVRTGHNEINVRALTGGTWYAIRTQFAWSGGWGTGPQVGISTPRIELGSTSVGDAKLRDGFLYVAHMGFVSSATVPRAVILWYKFRPDATQVEWGVVDDPTATVSYSYPSLAVNRSGTMLLAFGAFSKLEYPASAYITRDAQGRTSAVQTLKMGEGTWHLERWGDYTATVVDPANGEDFWTVQIIPMPARGLWQAWWMKLDAPSGKRRAVR